MFAYVCVYACRNIICMVHVQYCTLYNSHGVGPIQVGKAVCKYQFKPSACMYARVFVPVCKHTCAHVDAIMLVSCVILTIMGQSNVVPISVNSQLNALVPLSGIVSLRCLI